jgi:hypothetical protein
VDSRGIEKDASSTPRYGSLIRLSEVPERSTAMRQAGGAEMRVAPLPPAAERFGVRTPYPLPFFGAERQVRVEPDPHIGGAVGGPECSILSPDFCSGETGAPASSTLGYGSLTRLSEVLELSTLWCSWILGETGCLLRRRWVTGASLGSVKCSSYPRPSARGFSEKRVQAGGAEMRVAPLPQAAERFGVRTLHPLPFCGAEKWRTSTRSYRALQSSAEYGAYSSTL